ncbi:MAG: hypothetical protein Q4G09_02935 [Clostridia bacterium]|nr:hypothetical protein [Clostridia bacterium]
MDISEDILNNLYNGKININEKNPISKEYNELLGESNKILEEKEKELLNEYIEKKAQISSIECEEKFIEGYKIACKLIIYGIK